MSLQVETRVHGDVTVIDCSGDIRLGEGTTLFRNTLREVLKTGARKIVLNLGQVNYLDSTGIGELVGGYTSAHASGASIKMAQLPQKVYALLQITRLITIFEIYDSEEEALKHFA